MKKVLSVLLALVMMLSLSVVAFADATVSTVGDLRDALAAGGTVLGLAGLYWCWQKDWINALLMFALFPIQCIAYIIAVFFRPVL